MPRTPDFKISQNEEYVLVKISTPYIRITSTELMADGCDFTFYCQPYLLKLTFPYEIDGDDERCKATYDPNDNNGTITAFLPKKMRGQYFPDLDLTTKLLTVRAARDLKELPLGPLIDVVSSVSYGDADDDEVGSNNGATIGFDTTGEAAGDASLGSLRLSIKPHYGFNNQYSDALKSLREELLDVLQIKDPDTTPESDRRSLRLNAEGIDFDPERYLGDFFGAETDSIYMEAMQFEPFWSKQWELWKSRSKTTPSSNTSAASPVTSQASSNWTKDDAFTANGGFTADEQTVLSSGALKNREYLIAPGSSEEMSLFLSLADILFAYCYDCRITGGEPTVESSNTIANLSCTLSWLDAFREPGDHPGTVIVHCARRSVIHPYLRYWKLTRKVLTDVCKVLLLGRRCVLKCLLQIRAIFEHTDTHYMLNKLFIDDYCVWIQAVREEYLQRFATYYNNSKNAFEASGGADKGRLLVGFHLAELEQWAMTQPDNEDEDDEENGDDEKEVDASADDRKQIPMELLVPQLPTPLDPLPLPPLPAPSAQSSMPVAAATERPAGTASEGDGGGDVGTDGVISIRFLPSLTVLESGVRDMSMEAESLPQPPALTRPLQPAEVPAPELPMVVPSMVTEVESSRSLLLSSSSQPPSLSLPSKPFEEETSEAGGFKLTAVGEAPRRLVGRSSDLLRFEAAVMDEEGEVRMPLIQEIPSEPPAEK